MGPAFWAIDPHIPLWNTHSLLVEPGVLAENNVLHIESARDTTDSYHDDFIIDNVVIWFKTRSGRIPVGVSETRSDPDARRSRLQVN
jgi:hypothetical protein